MPRTYGNCGPVVTARTGIEVPDHRGARVDFDAVRARAALPVDQVLPVDRVHEQADAQTSVQPVQLVDQAVALPATAQAGPVVCDVCGVRVAAEYALRTGQTRHKPCQARVAGTGGRVVREVA